MFMAILACETELEMIGALTRGAHDAQLGLSSALPSVPICDFPLDVRSDHLTLTGWRSAHCCLM